MKADGVLISRLSVDTMYTPYGSSLASTVRLAVSFDDAMAKMPWYSDKTTATTKLWQAMRWLMPTNENRTKHNTT